MERGASFGIWFICAMVVALAVGFAIDSLLSGEAEEARAGVGPFASGRGPGSGSATHGSESRAQARAEAEGSERTESAGERSLTAPRGGEPERREADWSRSSVGGSDQAARRGRGTRKTGRAVDDVSLPTRGRRSAARGTSAAGAEPPLESPGEEGPEFGDDSQRSDEISDSPYVVSLEERAARAAEALELVDPVSLARRVEEQVPDGSLPPYELALAREDAEREILADALLIEDLAQKSVNEKLARGWAQTLWSNHTPEVRARMLEGVAESLEP